MTWDVVVFLTKKLEYSPQLNCTKIENLTMNESLNNVEYPKYATTFL